MRIVFVGSKDLGCLCLRELIDRKEEVVGVVARNDDPSKGMWYGSVSKIAEDNGIKLFRPKDINDRNFALEIRKLKPDVIFVVFYPQILKKHFIDIPKLGCINLHFAPLPKYRGCMPGAWAIINGEKEFGVSMHYIDEGVDSGDIVAQEFFRVTDEDTGETLYRKCQAAGQRLFKRTYPLIKEGSAPRKAQDESKVIYYRRGIPNDRYIDWDLPAKRIYDFVRALTFKSFPGPRTVLCGRDMIIKTAQISANQGSGSPGEVMAVLSGRRFEVCAKDRSVIIETEEDVKIEKGQKLWAKLPQEAKA